MSVYKSLLWDFPSRPFESFLPGQCERFRFGTITLILIGVVYFYIKGSFFLYFEN